MQSCHCTIDCTFLMNFSPEMGMCACNGGVQMSGIQQVLCCSVPLIAWALGHCPHKLISHFIRILNILQYE